MPRDLSDLTQSRALFCPPRVIRGPRQLPHKVPLSIQGPSVLRVPAHNKPRSFPIACWVPTGMNNPPLCSCFERDWKRGWG